MNICINPGPRSGAVAAPASKSQCNRLLLLAALGEKKSEIYCGELSNDLRALLSCLEAMGAHAEEREKGVFSVLPIELPKKQAELYCGESGSCLRFLMPLAGALGIDACFHTEGRLSERPVSALSRELCRHGMEIHKKSSEIYCSGRLQNGEFTLPGNCSSQYISALLMALPLLKGDSRLQITGPVESAPYVEMTEDALEKARIKINKESCAYEIPGAQRTALPDFIRAEGDYSSAAFFLCMAALSEEGIEVTNLPENSKQGDREILNILKNMGAALTPTPSGIRVSRERLCGIELDAAQIPDLVPAVAALAALSQGETRIINAGRLRLKESDRLRSCCAMLNALGAEVYERAEGLSIYGKTSLSGGKTGCFSDHRIAMAAAAAACGSEKPVIIEGAEAVEKSYPAFWRDFGSLKELT